MMYKVTYAVRSIARRLWDFHHGQSDIIFSREGVSEEALGSCYLSLRVSETQGSGKRKSMSNWWNY